MKIGENMRIKCKYCRSYISDTDERCSFCGAVNEDLKRVGDGVPRTIEELKQWYLDHNLPSEEITRFFIGKDYEKPRAFGIYYDENKNVYIVYKNKDTGERKIRYEGKDEEYAVNELYMRLKEEISNQKNLNNHTMKAEEDNTYNPISKLFFIHFISVFVVFFLIFFYQIAFGISIVVPAIFLFLSINPGIFIMFLISFIVKDKAKVAIIDKWWHLLSFIIFFILMVLFVVKPIIDHRNDAYYQYNNNIYYFYGGDWFYYNYGSWESYNGSTDNFEYLDDKYDSSYGASDFKNSSYYESNDWSSSSSNDWDSGSSWDSNDSWDSGGSDWSSDW